MRRVGDSAASIRRGTREAPRARRAAAERPVRSGEVENLQPWRDEEEEEEGGEEEGEEEEVKRAGLRCRSVV